MVTQEQLKVTLLSSGAVLVSLAVRDPACIQLGAIYTVGTADDPPGLEGLGRLAMTLMGNETDRHDREELQTEMDRHGMILDGDVMGEISILTLSCLPETIDGAFALMKETLVHSLLDRKELAREKRRTRADLAILNQDPESVAEMHARAAFFSHGHPLGRSTTPRSISAVTEKECTTWWGNHLARPPAILFMTGPLTHSEMIARAATLYSSSQVPPHSLFISPAQPNPSHIFITRSSLHQAALSALLPLPPRTHPDYLATRFAMYAWVEGGFASRLMTRFRVELGGTYGVQGRVATLKYGTHLSVKTTLNVNQLQSIYRIFIEEYHRLRAEGITEEEFEVTRDSFINAYPLLWDNALELGAYLVRQVHLGLSREEILAYPGQIERVTLQEVNAAAAQLPAEIPVIVAALPSKKEAWRLPDDFIHKKWETP